MFKKIVLFLYCDYVQEWLEQNNGRLWLTPALFSLQECPSPLEVLSELSLCPSLPSPQLLPKTSSALTACTPVVNDVTGGLYEREPLQVSRSTPPDQWLMDQLRMLHQNPAPCSQSSLLESQDAYVTLSANNHTEEEIQAEALPLEMLFTSRNQASCESHSDMGSVLQSSGSGHLSSQSSFEYPNPVWMPKPPGYTYMAAADSGVSMDYSPMSRVDNTGKVVIYANEYKNDMPAHEKAFLLRQHPVSEISFAQRNIHY